MRWDRDVREPTVFLLLNLGKVWILKIPYRVNYICKSSFTFRFYPSLIRRFLCKTRSVKSLRITDVTVSCSVHSKKKKIRSHNYIHDLEVSEQLCVRHKILSWLVPQSSDNRGFGSWSQGSMTVRKPVIYVTRTGVKPEGSCDEVLERQTEDVEEGPVE